MTAALLRHRWLLIVGSTLLLTSGAWSQESPEQSLDEVNPAELRRFWVAGSGLVPAAVSPYVLTSAEREKFTGTFGADLSHYSFDISGANCNTPAEYVTTRCSCVANWDEFVNNGIVFVYAKASDGAGVDRSFSRIWSELEAKHSSGKLYRGAYHFLRPGIDPDQQADTFLSAIGATSGKKPPQLSPVLDIEWSNKQIIPGTAQFDACPATRRTQNDQGTYFCDMWYTLPSSEIATLAKRWRDRVEKATGLPVTIYTNPTAWWNVVMSPADDVFLSGRPVWTSRYTSAGPQYDPRWTAQGGSPKWKMAPLPRGMKYPEAAVYNIPHFWQFSEAGKLASNVLTCNGAPADRKVDLNYIPLRRKEYPVSFKVAQ